jgi:hypothetical protein
LPLAGLSVLLTRCALTDHYSLASNAGGAGGASITSNGGSGSDAGAGETSIAGIDGISGSGGLSTDAGSTAGSSGATTIDPCNGACTAAETCCGSTCVNTATDQDNCGACGVACNAGRTCAASSCSVGWVKMAAPPVGFVARSRAAIAAMGKSVFIWGGLDSNSTALDTGEIYSPADDSWTPVMKGVGSPTARSMATALWTGSVVIVYGGVDPTGNTALKDAAAYDPIKQTWTSMGMSATRRTQALAFWDGNRAIFWGGTTPTNVAIGGGDRLEGMVWTPSAAVGDPGALLVPAVAFDGATVYVQGGVLGNVRTDKVSSYTLASDTWTALSNKAALTARSAAFGAWDGSHFVVWGGRDDNMNSAMSLHNDGKYLAGDTWMPMAPLGAPTPRLQFARRGGWAFAAHPGVVAIVGGEITISANGNGNLATNGAVYDVASNTWKAIADWPSGELHDYGMGVWTGEELVIWSGRDVLQSQYQGGMLTTTGERLAL